MMRLQAERGAGLYDDPFDLEAVTLLKLGVGCTGQVCGAVKLSGILLALLETFLEAFDFLRLVLVRDKQRVRRIDHQQIGNAD